MVVPIKHQNFVLLLYSRKSFVEILYSRKGFAERNIKEIKF